MKVRLILHGTMKGVLLENDILLELKEGATLVDMYEEIAKRARQANPSALWNSVSKRFRGPVLITSNAQGINNENACLYEGQTIEIKRFLIGG